MIQTKQLPTDILYSYLLRLSTEEHKHELEAILYLENNITNILTKTSNNSSSLIRLKWWYDQIRNSKTQKIELYDSNAKVLIDYLERCSDKEIDLLCNYIESFEPIMDRRVLNSIYDEYLANLSKCYFEIFRKYFAVSERTIFMLLIARFLDQFPRYYKSGWIIANNNEHFASQITELFDLARLNEKDLHNNDHGNFIYKSVKYILDSYNKKQIVKMDTYPEINLGMVKVRLGLFCLFCSAG